MGKAPEKPKKYEERLMDVFSFDEDDLDANQAGQLSRRQLNHLKAGRNSARYGGALLGLIGLMVLAILLPASVGSGFSASLIVPLVVGAIMAAGLVALSIRARRMSADLRENRVAESEGRVELQMKTGQNAASYYVTVDKRRFTIKQKAFLAFKNGDPYRIYYAPHSKRILLGGVAARERQSVPQRRQSDAGDRAAGGDRSERGRQGEARGGVNGALDAAQYPNR